ncbi:Phospholipid methyltransferase family protein [Aromatoleum petrolei]|nr:Phospholipid methyltransferase family protein [Aromatoleum petrolei]
MPRIPQMIASPRAQIFTGVILSALWGFFAAAHLVTFNLNGKASLLVFGVAETLIAAFFLLRTEPKSFTNNPHEWVVAVLGTFLPLLLRPTSDTPVPFAEWGVLLGSTMQIAAVLSLNRSLALVPALRELKTAGMYRFVRHPIYASYLFNFCFYLAANFSSPNLLIVAVSLTLLLARVYFEERHLAQTPEYRAYRSRVRWRLIPFVF